MDRWFILALLAILLFSLGSFFGKMASFKDIPYRVYFFEGIGTLTIFSSIMLLKRNDILASYTINIPGLLMGLCWGLGTVLFISALQHAKLSVTVPLTSVYPALTVILAVLFLGEKLETREIIGIFFAISAAVFLAKS